MDSLFKLYVDAIAYHFATSIAGSSCSGRVTPIRLPNVMRHNSGDTSSNCQASVDNRQELRSRGISRSLCLSQSRSEPGVKLRLVDDGELQFFSEFGEISSCVASDKGVVFFDNNDRQRGEAQITYKSDDLYQLTSLSLPTHVGELVTDLSNVAPQVFHDAATALFARLPLQHRRFMSGKGS